MNTLIQSHFNLDPKNNSQSKIPLKVTLEKRKLTYYEAIKMVYDIEVQIKLLENNNQGLLLLSIDDIYIINNHYIIVNNANIFSLVQGKLFINRPFNNKSPFLAPEFNGVTKIPIKSNKSVSYYSFALMIINLMGISNDLKDIKNTKLYYMLKRCLNKEPTNRFFLYI